MYICIFINTAQMYLLFVFLHFRMSLLAWLNYKILVYWINGPETIYVYMERKCTANHQSLLISLQTLRWCYFNYIFGTLKEPRGVSGEFFLNATISCSLIYSCSVTIASTCMCLACHHRFMSYVHQVQNTCNFKV